MIKKLLFASALASFFYGQAQTTVFKEDFEDEAKHPSHSGNYMTETETERIGKF